MTESDLYHDLYNGLYNGLYIEFDGFRLTISTYIAQKTHVAPKGTSKQQRSYHKGESFCSLLYKSGEDVEVKFCFRCHKVCKVLCLFVYFYPISR